jgi:hypothetical protein
MDLGKTDFEEIVVSQNTPAPKAAPVTATANREDLT